MAGADLGHRFKVLLLENIHEIAVERLKEVGFEVEVIGRSLGPDELGEKLKGVHALGIRSKTRILPQHLESAKELLAVGCFGVGTNQLSIADAANRGIPVFNAPYGNTRSVAELTIASLILLARGAVHRIVKMHQGFWDKSAKGAHEVRGKVIGVVGYGHIGQQVGLLAEAVGMQVLFYDRMKRLPLGNARPASSFEELLAQADFVTLHVPALADGSALVAEQELKVMKKGGYLLNLSRGSLVDFSAVKEALHAGHLAGAAIDVYPSEPKTNNEEFHCELAGVDNVVLTPHLGGSTVEAQYNIGVEVSTAMMEFLTLGSTSGSVNFPQVNLPLTADSHRIVNVHRNVPGVLKDVNKIISDLGANINAQYLGTQNEVGYLIADVNRELSGEVCEQIGKLESSIKTRVVL